MTHTAEVSTGFSTHGFFLHGAQTSNTDTSTHNTTNTFIDTTSISFTTTNFSQTPATTTTVSELVPLTGTVLLALLMMVVIVLGVVGNSIVCVLVYRKAAMRSSINLLVAQLAFSDILLSCLVMPYALAGLFLPESWGWRREMCAMQAFLHELLVTLNTFVLLTVTLDRYLIIVHRKEKLNVRRARVLILSAWVLSLLTTLPPLLGWGTFAMYPGHPQCLDFHPEGASDLSYVGINCFLTRYFPLAAMLYSYACMLSTVRRKSMKVQHYSMDLGVPPGVGRGRAGGNGSLPPPPKPRTSVSGALKDFPSSPDRCFSVSSTVSSCPPSAGANADHSSSAYDGSNLIGRESNHRAAASSSHTPTSPVCFVTASSSLYLQNNCRQQAMRQTKPHHTYFPDVHAQNCNGCAERGGGGGGSGERGGIGEGKKGREGGGKTHLRDGGGGYVVTSIGLTPIASSPVLSSLGKSSPFFNSSFSSSPSNEFSPSSYSSARRRESLTVLPAAANQRNMEDVDYNSKVESQTCGGAKTSSDKLSSTPVSNSSTEDCNSSSKLSGNLVLIAKPGSNCTKMNGESPIVTSHTTVDASPDRTHDDATTAAAIQTKNGHGGGEAHTATKMKTDTSTSNSVSRSSSNKEHKQRNVKKVTKSKRDVDSKLIPNRDRSNVDKLCENSSNSHLRQNGGVHSDVQTRKRGDIKSNGHCQKIVPPSSPLRSNPASKYIIEDDTNQVLSDVYNCVISDVHNSIISDVDIKQSLTLSLSTTSEFDVFPHEPVAIPDCKATSPSTNCYDLEPDHITSSQKNHQNSHPVPASSSSSCFVSTSCSHTNTSSSCSRANASSSCSHANASSSCSHANASPSCSQCVNTSSSCSHVNTSSTCPHVHTSASCSHVNTSSSCPHTLPLSSSSPAPTQQHSSTTLSSCAEHASIWTSSYSSPQSLIQRIPLSFHLMSSSSSSSHQVPLPSSSSSANQRPFSSYFSSRSSSYLSSPSGFSPGSGRGVRSGRRTAGTRKQVLDMSLRTRAFKTILILSLLLCLCWMPYATAILVTSLAGQPQPVLLLLLLWLGFFKSGLNPVVYCLRIRKFRDACKENLPRSCYSCYSAAFLPDCFASLSYKRRVNPSAVYQCSHQSADSSVATVSTGSV